MNTYIISQVFVILDYGLLALSYYGKSRKSVLIMSFLAVVANTIAYILLNAYTGVAMCIVAIIRNIIFLIDERKNGKSDKIYKKDIVILIILFAISIISSIFTYNGFYSLLVVFGTMIYTYSVWQKKISVYKILGIPTEFLFVLYNIYIKSIFGVIAETILMICSIIGYVLEIKRNRSIKEKE